MMTLKYTVTYLPTNYQPSSCILIINCYTNFIKITDRGTFSNCNISDFANLVFTNKLAANISARILVNIYIYLKFRNKNRKSRN